jgi:hypothetical protein
MKTTEQKDAQPSDHATLRVMRFEADDPFAVSIVEKLKHVDDDSRFISVDEFMRRYGHLRSKGK